MTPSVNVIGPTDAMGENSGPVEAARGLSFQIFSAGHPWFGSKRDCFAGLKNRRG
jgi:hypothetical protein